MIYNFEAADIPFGRVKFHMNTSAREGSRFNVTFLGGLELRWWGDKIPGAQLVEARIRRIVENESGRVNPV